MKLPFLSTLVLSLLLSTPAFAQGGFDDPGAGGVGGKGGDLTAVEAKVDGGSVSLGSSSQVVVLFRNDDIKPLTIGEISLYPSSNISASIGENQCSLEALAPASVCAVAVNLKGLRPGNYRTEMLLKHDGRTKLLTATVTGEVASSDTQAEELISDIETIPAELDFGTLNASRQMVRSVILRNTTSEEIEVANVTIQSGAQSGFSIESDCATLRTGQACLASVTWAPNQKGPSTGILLVEHNGPTRIASVPMKGSYEPTQPTTALIYPEAVPGKGLMISSLDTIDFGTGVETKASITVSLVNTGDAPMTIRGVAVSGDDSGIEINKGGCGKGVVLEPVQACPLTVTWQPSREGAIVDDIQVFHDGARGVLVIPVRGSAERAYNKDSESLLLGDDGEAILRVIPALNESDVDGGGEGGTSSSGGRVRTERVQVDAKSVLESYSITSQGPGRAVVTGPGGSRVVFDNQETVIGGVLWQVRMRASAIEFVHEKQKVLMLFDKSLTSLNQSGSQSNSGDSNSEASAESFTPAPVAAPVAAPAPAATETTDTGN